MDAIKKLIGRKTEHHEEPEEENTSPNADSGAGGGEEAAAAAGERKPRFADDPPSSGGKAEKKSARFADPTPPSPGKKRDKKVVRVQLGGEDDESGKKNKPKATSEKKPKQSVPPVGWPETYFSLWEKTGSVCVWICIEFISYRCLAELLDFSWNILEM